MAYGAHKAVAVYDPVAARVLRTLPGHDAPVTVVRWIPDDDAPGRWLVSGDSSGVVVLWHRVDTPGGGGQGLRGLIAAGTSPQSGKQRRGVDPDAHKWEMVSKQKAHDGPVLDARAERTVAGGKRTGIRLLATASQDCAVTLFRLDLAPAPAPASAPGSDASPGRGARGEPEGPKYLVPAGGLTFPLKRLPLSLALRHLPGTHRLVLAVGGADGGIKLFLCSTEAIDRREAADSVVMNPVVVEPCASLLGHTDWVRDLAFTEDDDFGDENVERQRIPGLLLASASQDRTARVWRVRVVPVIEDDAAELGPEFARLAAPPAPPCVALNGMARIATALEALLQGHEDWVMSVTWRPKVFEGDTEALLTASADRSLISWTPVREFRAKDLNAGNAKQEQSQKVWMASESMGDASSSCLGFYGAMFDANAERVLAHAHGGALHAWRRAGDKGSERWVPTAASAGHAGEVTCLSWDQSGRFVVSGSNDLTARMHASWDNVEEEDDDDERENDADPAPAGWREIARPQIHGHQVTCVATLPPPGTGDMQDSNTTAKTVAAGSTTFVSGADEKTLRVFDAPGTFLGTLARSLQKSDAAGRASLDAARKSAGDLSGGAELPQLGLSNKALKPVAEHSNAQSASEHTSEQTEHNLPLTPEQAAVLAAAKEIDDAACLKETEEHDDGDTFEPGFGFLDAPAKTPVRPKREGVTIFTTPGAGNSKEHTTSETPAKTPDAQVLEAEDIGSSFKRTPRSGKSAKKVKDSLPEKSIEELMASDVAKSTYTEDGVVGGVVPMVYSRAPAEEALASATLWPESRKLYGHGDDVCCVAAHSCGTLVASACEARSAEAAAIWIWDSSSDWRPLGKLPGATLTVVALHFASAKGPRRPRPEQESPSFFMDGAHTEEDGAPEGLTPEISALLAASRDRHVSIYVPPANAVRDGTGQGAWGSGWTLATRVKAHAKAMYDAKWAPCTSDAFATCGRDKRVKVWRVDHQSAATADDSIPAFACAVTSVAFAPRRVRGKLILAIGLEDGGIKLVTGDPMLGRSSARRGNPNFERPPQSPAGGGSSNWVTLCTVPNSDSHMGPVRAMAWKPWCPTYDIQTRAKHDDDDSDVDSQSGSPVLSFFGLSLADNDDDDAEADGPMMLGSCGADHTVRLFTVKRQGGSVGDKLKEKGEKSPLASSARSDSASNLASFFGL